MRSEGKKRTLELSLIQGFSKIEKLFGGATSNINVKLFKILFVINNNVYWPSLYLFDNLHIFAGGFYVDWTAKVVNYFL